MQQTTYMCSMNTRSRNKSKALQMDNGQSDPYKETAFVWELLFSIRRRLLCSFANKIETEKNFNMIIICLFYVLYIHIDTQKLVGESRIKFMMHRSKGMPLSSVHWDIITADEVWDCNLYGPEYY